MELNEILYIVVPVVTFVLGLIAKKSDWFKNNLIPLQNLAIGIIAGIIYYIVTKDIDLVIVGLGLFSGGTYDIFNNLFKLKKGK